MNSALDPAAAAAILHRSGVIAYPTEAVWGIGCDPFDEGAVLRLLMIKQRPVGKGLILIAASLAQVEPLIDRAGLPGERLDAVLASWPGPHTWLLPCRLEVPQWLRGEHSTLALRVTAHPVVVALCDAFAGPLVSTSANLTGHPPARRRETLDRNLLDQLDGVVFGDTGSLGAPTPIRDAATGDVIRA